MENQCLPDDGLFFERRCAEGCNCLGDERKDFLRDKNRSEYAGSRSSEKWEMAHCPDVLRRHCIGKLERWRNGEMAELRSKWKVSGTSAVQEGRKRESARRGCS